jgi:hypothetical protein
MFSDGVLQDITSSISPAPDMSDHDSLLVTTENDLGPIAELTDGTCSSALSCVSKTTPGNNSSLDCDRGEKASPCCSSIEERIVSALGHLESFPENAHRINCLGGCSPLHLAGCRQRGKTQNAAKIHYPRWVQVYRVCETEGTMHQRHPPM